MKLLILVAMFMTDLPVTQQVQCWDDRGIEIGCAGTQHDGDTQAGKRLNDDGRFKEKDGHIIDTWTNLMWSSAHTCPDEFSSANDFDWYDAEVYIYRLNNGEIKDAEPYTDWRFPNIFELYSLISFKERRFNHPLDFMASAIGKFTTRRCDPLWYWSGTTSIDPEQRDKAFVIDLRTGEIMLLQKAKRIGVWPVRGGIDNGFNLYRGQ